MGPLGAEPVRLETAGPVVGLFHLLEFEQETLGLREGDLLVSFTDGVTEALDSRGEEFGEDRLRETVESARVDSARAEAMTSSRGSEPESLGTPRVEDRGRPRIEDKREWLRRRVDPGLNIDVIGEHVERDCRRCGPGSETSALLRVRVGGMRPAGVAVAGGEEREQYRTSPTKVHKHHPIEPDVLSRAGPPVASAGI